MNYSWLSCWRCRNNMFSSFLRSRTRSGSNEIWSESDLKCFHFSSRNKINCNKYICLIVEINPVLHLMNLCNLWTSEIIVSRRINFVRIFISLSRIVLVFQYFRLKVIITETVQKIGHFPPVCRLISLCSLSANNGQHKHL